jgi:hypothetical protein
MEVLVVEVMEGVERIERRRVKRWVWTRVSQGSCMKFGFMRGLEGSREDCRQTHISLISKYPKDEGGRR